MCHHLNALGQFQSDQYPNMRPDEIMLSFRLFCNRVVAHIADLTEVDGIAVVIVKRLDAIADEFGVGKKLHKILWLNVL